MLQSIIGIDPGLNGALVKIMRAPNGFALLYAAKLPLKQDHTVDSRMLTSLLRHLACDDVALEQALACKFVFRASGDSIRQSAVSGFTCGLNYGKVLASLEEASKQTRIYAPRSWTSQIHKGAFGTTPKEKSLFMFEQLCSPNTKPLAKLPRAIKYHEGIVDACLIAFYALHS